MSNNNSGLAAVDEAAATISKSTHDAAVASAREEGRKAGHAAGKAEGLAEGRGEAKAAADAREEGLKAGRLEGATAERTRLEGIEAAALPGHDKLVAECKADPTCTPGDAAMRINAAERKLRENAGKAIVDVERTTGKVTSSPASERTDQPAKPASSAAILADKDKPLEERCKAAFEADADLRAEFGKLETLVAYQQAIESGKAKIFKGR